jgi:hypothetical protein
LRAIRDLAARFKNKAAAGEKIELSPRATPWVVAAGVKRLIDAGKLSEARELASLYRDLAYAAGRRSAVPFATHLLRLIDAARNPVDSAKP